MRRPNASWLVGGWSAAIAITYLSVVPRQYVHVDHHGATETLRRMRAGQGFYDALRDTYWFDSGIRLGGPRSFRTPFLFEVLQLFPPRWFLFVLVVVVGSCVLLADASAHPYAALPVALFLLVAGRRFGAGRMETWMFVELGRVPPRPPTGAGASAAHGPAGRAPWQPCWSASWPSRSCASAWSWRASGAGTGGRGRSCSPLPWSG